MLEFRNIRKSFFGVEVLHGVSFSVDYGKVTALMGENGAGKSTLMKILSGVISDYEGEIFLDGKLLQFKNTRQAEQAGVSIIHQELNLIPDLSVAENIFLGKEPKNKLGFINYKKLFSDAKKILDTFNFPFQPNVKVKNLSVGWQQIVEIARVFNQNSKVIILDEPTSALSENEVNILFEKIKILKEQNKIIIYISHKLEEIDKIADEVVILRDGLFIDKKKKTDISKQEIISKMIGKNYVEATFSNKHLGDEDVLIAENLTLKDNDTIICDNLNFSVKKGEILGITGLLGSGKSELLQFLFGFKKYKFSGTISLFGKKHKPTSTNKSILQSIFYLSKNRKEESIFDIHHITFNTTISNLKSISNYFFIYKKKEKNKVIELIKELKVKMNSLSQQIRTLSGGNQQKILLGRAILTNPKLLLLDEPTRGIDVASKDQIYEILFNLAANGISIIISSSEIPELMKTCDRILVLSNGKQTAYLETNRTNEHEILQKCFE